MRARQQPQVRAFRWRNVDLFSAQESRGLVVLYQENLSEGTGSGIIQTEHDTSKLNISLFKK
jgi:hypothetical protein